MFIDYDSENIKNAGINNEEESKKLNINSDWRTVSEDSIIHINGQELPHLRDKWSVALIFSNTDSPQKHDDNSEEHKELQNNRSWPNLGIEDIYYIEAIDENMLHEWNSKKRKIPEALTKYLDSNSTLEQTVNCLAMLIN